jgi:hypothetical protein
MSAPSDNEPAPAPVVDVGGGDLVPAFERTADALSGPDVELQVSSSTPLIVEDGTGLANSNSYATVAEADAYFDALQLPAAWIAAGTGPKEQALRVATQWLDASFGSAWLGIRSSSAQALDWPRIAATDQSGMPIGAIVPARVKAACAEVALRFILDPTSLSPDIPAGEGAVRSESITVGPIQISEAFNGEQTTEATFRLVRRLLRTAGLIDSGDWARR